LNRFLEPFLTLISLSKSLSLSLLLQSSPETKVGDDLTSFLVRWPPEAPPHRKTRLIIFLTIFLYENDSLLLLRSNLKIFLRNMYANRLDLNKKIPYKITAQIGRENMLLPVDEQARNFKLEFLLDSQPVLSFSLQVDFPSFHLFCDLVHKLSVLVIVR
jgi:hypothetical protein